MEDVCSTLSISAATARNWIRLGKLLPAGDGKTFCRDSIEKMRSEMESGGDSRLKSRRNKKRIRGKALYKDYIQHNGNCAAVGRILLSCRTLTEEGLRLILAHFAVQLYNQSKGIPVEGNSLCDKEPSYSKDPVFLALVLDLLGKVTVEGTVRGENGTMNRDEATVRIEGRTLEGGFLDIGGAGSGGALEYLLEFVPTEDTLGFLYISLRDLGARKQTGAYYTPGNVVGSLADRLCAGSGLEGKTFFDPCCGTGNFLIGLLNRGVDASNVYGQDLDEISVQIARINLFLLDGSLTKAQLERQVICGDTLADTSGRKFSVVLGNPPWGYVFSPEEIEYLLKHYRTARPKGMESYDLFIEKGIGLLEPEGYLAYVLPEALFGVASHKKARECIVESCSFRFVQYFGDIFPGVQCPAVLMVVQKSGKGKTQNCQVSYQGREFTICEDRSFGAASFLLHMDDGEYHCLEAISSVADARYLAGNAKFALGIVTGDNKAFLKDAPEDGAEWILKGSDILRYSVKQPNHYIQFTKNAFQQVAPIELYRAEEKLLYRFISDMPVFAYDNKQMLTLNSCNILIPQIAGMEMKYVLAALNSRVAAYFFRESFHSVKLLRSHIETLPIPMPCEAKQREIVEYVERMMDLCGDKARYYEELDNLVMDLYSLKANQKEIIRKAISGRNLYLA